MCSVATPVVMRRAVAYSKHCSEPLALVAYLLRAPACSVHDMRTAAHEQHAHTPWHGARSARIVKPKSTVQIYYPTIVQRKKAALLACIHLICFECTWIQARTRTVTSIFASMYIS
jgi:hypothetical protein